MLDVGTEAPAFRLNNQHGDIVNLSDYAGKWVVVWWYPKASTRG